ncbi:Gfo/Idh/MocA family protein [Spongisporangium articulatum]|uniref:Gfo/Idh/MocA family protein n=1 Tax=Spongisporangium articulatum TaxID=3362603 RepID=A0ABW8AH17_9ACTN
MTEIRWGVLGTGNIGTRFVADLAQLEDATVHAIASRDATRAEEIAQQYGVTRAYGDYRALCEDPEVDAVYVASPHPFHLEHALLAIEAGKAVLVEKPFTMTGSQARTLVDAARAADVFCMEAMWTRFLPTMVELRRLLGEGVLGEVRALYADHGQWFASDPEHRLFAPDLGGGALLDLGVYPVSFASMVLGPPAQVQAAATPAFTGVDLTTSALLTYATGAHAVLTCTSGARTPVTAWVAGDEGRVEIDRTWYAGGGFTVIPRDGEPWRYDGPPVTGPGAGGREAKGLRFQAAEVGRCVAAGLRESPVLPLAETIAVMDTLDAISATAAPKP